jgi:hypothetical protein
MTDNTPTDGKDVTVSVHFNNSVWNGIKKIGRDILVSAGLNAASFATHVMPVTDFAQTLAQKFELAAVGTVVTAAGITVGRYAGGAVGAGIDAVTHNSEGRHRKTGATIGGTILGAGTFLTYQSGLWALAGG